MKTKVKYLILTSIMAVLFFGTALSVNAETSGTCGDNLIWTLDDEGTLTIKGNGDMCSCSYSGGPWNDENDNINNLIIEEGITSISAFAFKNIKNLTSVTVPNGVTSIGNSAFAECYNLTHIELPNTLLFIDDYAFYCCYNLTDITIPFQVSDVGYYVFDGCINLKTINLPESLKDKETKFSISSAKIIYYDVFWTVYYIDFIDSNNIFHLFASENVRHTMNTTMNFTTMKNYDLTDYYTGEFFDGICITSNRFIKAIKKPTVTYTGDYTGEETIKDGGDVILPSPPEGYIYVFTVNGEQWDGTNITSDVTVTVKKLKLHTVTFIGDYTGTITVTDGENAELPYNGYDYKYKFTVSGEEWDGTNITSDVTVTVKKVNVYHVYSCIDSEWDFHQEVEENEDAELPQKGYKCRYVYMWGDEEWDGKNVTSDVYLMVYKYELVSSGKCGDNINYYLYDDGLLSIEGTGKMANYSSSSSAPWKGFIKKVSISDGITSIGDYAFYGFGNIESINIPDGVTSIGGSAFYKCVGLESITLPDSVTTINGGAFENCSNLSDINIPTGVTFIGYYTFRQCKNLTSIFIPANVETIGYYAFRECGLTEINVDAKNKNYSSLDGVLFNKDIRQGLHIRPLRIWAKSSCVILTADTLR